MKRTATRKATALSFAILLLTTAFCATATIAAADTVKPQLLSVTTGKPAYSDGEQIEFILKFFDASGVDISKLGMIVNLTDSANKYGTRVVLMDFITVDISTQFYSSAQKLQGYEAYSCKVPVAPNFATGEYYIPQLDITDNAQNQIAFQCFAPLSNMDRITFNVTNSERQDITGPVPVSVSADKTSVSVGETIRFTVKAQDASGLSGGNMRIVREGQGQWLNYELRVKAGSTDTLEHSFTPAADTAPGVYTLQNLAIYDNAGYQNGCYFSTIADPDYFDAPALLANNFRFSFTIVNPDYAQKQDPRVTLVKFSRETVLPGDTVGVEVTVDDGGTPLENYMYLRINKTDENNNATQIGGANLLLTSDGKYKGTYRVPAVYQQRVLRIGYMIYHKNGYNTQYSALDDTGYIAPVLTIGSVFSGIEDASVMVGGNFDPMAGISAVNDTEGNLSAKIRLEGYVDCQTSGVYMLKYTVPSSLSYIKYQEENPNGNYFASRLVGVTEVEPSGYASPEDEPLAVAEDSVFVGADPEDVVIEKDGQSIAFTDELTAEGVYEITDVSAEQNVSAGLWNGSTSPVTFLSARYASPSTVFLSQAVAASGSKSVIVLIDRSAPVISQITTKTASAAMSVQISVKDLSPVSKIRYMSGTQDRSTIEKSGTVIKNNYKFTAAAGDTFSVLATDTLGHTRLSVLTIKQTAAVSSADPTGSEDLSAEGSTASDGSSADDSGNDTDSTTSDDLTAGNDSTVSFGSPASDRKSGAVQTVIIVVAVLLVAGGIVAGLFYYSRRRVR